MEYLTLDRAIEAEGYVQLSGDAATTQQTGDSSQAGRGMGADYLSLGLSLVLMIAVFYFFLIRPQKKREKETQKMQNELQVGDEVVTTSGIVGIVVNIKEDTVLIETGNDRSKIRIKRWAIQSNETIHE